LQELERAILRQDPALDPPWAEPAAAAERLGGSILVAPSSDAGILPLCSIAEQLARQPARELIVVRLLRDEEDPTRATGDLAALRDELVGHGLDMRVAANVHLHRAWLQQPVASAALSAEAEARVRRCAVDP
jgi:hypothetical protein